MQVELPDELVKLFEDSGFCPHEGIRGRVETGTGWNTIHVEYDDGGDCDYPEGRMYLHYHHEELDGNRKVKKATKAFASPCPSDARFIKAFVDWMQSMTQAKPREPSGWFCPHCNETVPPECVTNDERHDERAGGCGGYVN